MRHQEPVWFQIPLPTLSTVLLTLAVFTAAVLIFVAGFWLGECRL